jgi:hypothetical protein
MAKLKVELEANDWQALLMLINQGYTGVCARLNEQLVAANPPQPPGNGEVRPPAEPPQ